MWKTTSAATELTGSSRLLSIKFYTVCACRQTCSGAFWLGAQVQRTGLFTERKRRTPAQQETEAADQGPRRCSCGRTALPVTASYSRHGAKPACLARHHKGNSSSEQKSCAKCSRRRRSRRYDDQASTTVSLLAEAPGIHFVPSKQDFKGDFHSKAPAKGAGPSQVS